MTRPAGFYPWSPGEQADADQQHAEAMERLRVADAWFLVVGKPMGDDKGVIVESSGGGMGNLLTHMAVLAHARSASTEMLREGVRHARGEDE